MAGEQFFSGFGGEEIKIFVEGIQVAALQNFSYKATQKKSAIRGAGTTKAFGTARGVRDYTFDFEVKEWNGAILDEPPAQARSGNTTIESFTIKGVTYTSLLDLKNFTITVLTPTKNGVQKVKKFTGCDITDVEGTISIEDEAIPMKCSGIALDADGLL